MVIGDVQGAGGLLERYVAAGDRQDYDALRQLLTEGIVTHSPGRTEIVGVDALIATWVAAHEGLEELDHEVRELVDSGATAVGRIRVSGVHRGPFLGVAPTGAPLDVDLALFVRIEEGRIAEMWEIVDTGLALRQLGVLDDQPLSPGS